MDPKETFSKWKNRPRKHCRISPRIAGLALLSPEEPPFGAHFGLARKLYTRDIHDELRHILCVVCLISSCVNLSMIVKGLRFLTNSEPELSTSSGATVRSLRPCWRLSRYAAKPAALFSKKKTRNRWSGRYHFDTQGAGQKSRCVNTL